MVMIMKIKAACRLNLRNEMNIDNYLNYPEETTTEVELTDQDIIDLVTHEDMEVDDVL